MATNRNDVIVAAIGAIPPIFFMFMLATNWADLSEVKAGGAGLAASGGALAVYRKFFA